MSPWSLLAVAAGGALGTLGRLSADLAMTQGERGPELATLVVNVLGAMALGFAMGHGLPRWSPALKDGLTIGVLGSYTTMSGVSLIAIAGPWPFSLGYLAVTFVLAGALAWLSYRWGASGRSRTAQRGAS